MAFPLPQFMPRTRREVNPTDSINSRQFEHWQTGGKYGIYHRPDVHKQAPFYDVMPNTSRMSDKSYRSQPRFDADAERGVQNPYFVKYDATFDSRNMVRELKSSVYEDKNTGYAKESEQLASRNMDHRWMSPVSYVPIVDQLRPKMDDIQRVYRTNGEAEKKRTT